MHTRLTVSAPPNNELKLTSVAELPSQELRKIKLDLLALDDQVDVDKQQIQTKIIKVHTHCVKYAVVPSRVYVCCNRIYVQL